MFFSFLGVLATFIIGLRGTMSEPSTATPARNPREFNITCDFKITNNIYYCSIENIGVAINENANIVFIGKHLPGHSNVDVKGVYISNAVFPLSIESLLNSLPNLNTITISSLNYDFDAIMTYFFRNGKGFIDIQIIKNPMLNEIQVDAFFGATNTQILNLASNFLRYVTEFSFRGLGSLLELNLSENKFFSVLPFQIFKPLLSLKILDLSRSNLNGLKTRDLEYNHEIETLYISSNDIFHINKEFFDPIPKLSYLDLLGNDCVNKKWKIDGVHVTMGMVRKDLKNCFDRAQERSNKNMT